MLQCNLYSSAFTYKTYNIVFIFEIFHLQSNVCLKASLALIHLTTFILRSSNLEWEEKEFVVKLIFSIGATFIHVDTHTHTSL